MNVKHLVAAVTVLAATVGLTAGVAAAGAPQQDTVTVTCGSQTFTANVRGNGPFTPAHVIDSTTMLIPVSFGSSTYSVYDPAGNLVDQFTDPGPQLKGKKGTGVKNTVDCTYAGGGVSDGSDPEGPPAGYTFQFSGEVTGFITPRGR
jgi:hypothetical protein